MNKIILLIFSLAVIFSLFLLPKVETNYNMLDYMPDETQSAAAVSVMKEEFGDFFNAKVMLEDVSFVEVIEYKQKIMAIDGVVAAFWLDDMVGGDGESRMMAKYYVDETALISLIIEEGREREVVSAIYEIIGDNALAGSAIDRAVVQNLTVNETMRGLIILVPIIILILIMATGSFLRPILFLLVIGVSVLINMGSNIVLGEVSFLTRAITPVLQLAVSLDYAIFLLKSFDVYRARIDDLNLAMKKAVRKALPVILGSAATTFFGFVALSLMDFRIGSELGISLMKGVVFSFLSVFFLLPVLVLFLHKWIPERKSLLPNFYLGKYLLKFRFFILGLVVCLIVPAFFMQSNNQFIYGSQILDDDSRSMVDLNRIEKKFGNLISIVVLVPKGDLGSELALSIDLMSLDRVEEVISLPFLIGDVPIEYVSEEILKEFYSLNYARIIVNVDTDQEGDEAFLLVNEIKEKTSAHYDQFYVLGDSVGLSEMKEVIEHDNLLVNWVAIGLILIVLLFVFRSLSISLLLLLTIQGAIWINLAIPYLMNTPLSYMGFLIVGIVQLGVTIDYAILLTHRYLIKREELVPKEAMVVALNESLESILTSASILAVAGFILYFTSLNKIVSEFGALLGRGALISVAMVIIFLPALLIIFDRVIGKK